MDGPAMLESWAQETSPGNLAFSEVMQSRAEDE